MVFAINWMHDQKKARLNLHGKDVFADRQDTNMDAGRAVGAQYTEFYKSSDVQIRVDYTITKNCDGVTEGDCEGRWVSARITATSRDERQVLKTQGYCGC